MSLFSNHLTILETIPLIHCCSAMSFLYQVSQNQTLQTWSHKCLLQSKAILVTPVQLAIHPSAAQLSFMGAVRTSEAYHGL